MISHIYDVKLNLLIPIQNLKLEIQQYSGIGSRYFTNNNTYDFEFDIDFSHSSWAKDWHNDVYVNRIGQVRDYKRDIHIEMGALMHGCFIKELESYDDYSIHVKLSSDYFEKVDFDPIIAQRRDFVIDQILST